jgi:hypothetical protein
MNNMLIAKLINIVSGKCFKCNITWFNYFSVYNVYIYNGIVEHSMTIYFIIRFFPPILTSNSNYKFLQVADY